MMNVFKKVVPLLRGSDRRFLMWSLGLGLVFHGVFAWVSVQQGWSHWNIDEVNVARRLLHGQGFSFDYYGLFGDGLVDGAFFPPGYVYNCYALLALFGSTTALLVENVLFTVAVAYLLYLVGILVFNRDVARVALLLALLYPPFFVRVGHGSPVYFKMFLMAALIYAVQRVWILGRGAWSAGLVGGLLALAMPDVLLYVAMCGGALVVRDRFNTASIRKCLAMGCGALLVVLPWTARNYARFDTFCLLSTNGGFNFYMGNNPETRGEVDYEAVKRLDVALGGELSAAGEFERDGILYREGNAYIAEHPLASIRNLISRSVTHWFFRPENRDALLYWKSDKEYARSFIAYVWLYLMSYSPLLILALGGLYLVRSEWERLVPLLVACLYSTLIAAVFVVQTKMRLIKAEPVLPLLAAVFLVRGWTPLLTMVGRGCEDRRE